MGRTIVRRFMRSAAGRWPRWPAFRTGVLLGLLAAGGLTLGGLTVGRVSAQTITDFDQKSLAEDWTAVGKTTSARRLPVPDGVKQKGVSGHYVEFKMDPGGRLLTRAETKIPPPGKAAAVRFAIQAEHASKDQPAVLECQFFCERRPAWRWCKLELTDTKWQVIELPLRYFRHSSGAFVDWSEVSRVGLMARTAGTFRLDNLELIQDDKGSTGALTAKELGEIAFGPQAQLYESRHFSIVTNCEDLDQQTVLNSLEQLYDQVSSDFPDFPALPSKVPLMIFAREEDYQSFFGKLEPRIRSSINRPRTPGYTLFGIACCVYSNDFGPVRPIYTHEACHALFARQLGLGNQGEWLHEGLANHYQTTLLNQDRVGPARFVLESPTAWNELLSGKKVPLNRYAHVMFFVEWMMADDQRRETLGVAMKQMREQRTTRFDELVVQLLRQPEAELQASYKAFVESIAAGTR